jgi:flagellar biosynthesis protein
MAGSVDPSRLAIALRYDFKGAPRVTAKGRGYVARDIVDKAREHGVSIEENPALAHALSQVELDDEIPEALYRAIAEILAFVLRVNQRRAG